MRTILFITSICFFISTSLAQQNNILRGKLLYLSSNKTPAIGVEISGIIDGIEKANLVYTTNDGSYSLTFPAERDGHKVSLNIGSSDQKGQSIEVVNIKEVEDCKIPAKASDEFEIIVCRSGSRDIAAQRYYNIFKISTKVALENAEKEWDRLASSPDKDYERLRELNKWITQTKKQNDSLKLYKEAYRIASINKDNASKRVLRYISLLDEGKSILEAREALSIESAAVELALSNKKFKAAIEELRTRVGASMGLFDYEDVIMCYDTIITYSEAMGIAPRTLSEYYSDFAFTFYEDGKYKIALEKLKKTIEIQEKVMGFSDPDLAKSYMGISKTYRALGKYEDALNFQQKAIGIQSKILPEKHIDLANSYSNLGLIYQAQGKYDTAVVTYQKSTSIKEHLLPASSQILASSYSDISLIYLSKGQYNTALEYLQKSLKIKEEVLPLDHPNLATTYSNIGSTYEALGEYEKALEYQHKAINIESKILNPNHPTIAMAYNNLGTTYETIGNYEKALSFQHKSIKIRELILEPNHPDLAISYNDIALTYRAIHEYEKALKFILKSLDIRTEVLASNHPELAQAYHNTALVYQSLLQFDKALEYQKKVLEIMNEAYEPNHPNLALAINNIAISYKALRDHDKALAYQNKALSIWEIALEPGHPYIGYGICGIADIYTGMKKFNLADSSLRKGYEIFKSSLQANHPFYSYANNIYIRLYQDKALANIEKENYSAALNDLDSVLTKVDSSFQDLYTILNLKGLCYLHLGDYPNSIKVFKSSSKLVTEQTARSYYNNIGIAYAKNAQFKEAKVALTKLEQLSPKDGLSYRNWAIFYALQKEKDKTISYLLKAIELGYDDWEWLEKENSLEIIKKEKSFIKMIKKLKKNS